MPSMPVPKDHDLAPLTAAVSALQSALGQIGTDASALDRVGAEQFLQTLDPSGRTTTAPEVVAILDSPSGYTQRRRIVFLGTAMAPRRFDAQQRVELARHIDTVLDFEIPVVLHRWAFDQVMSAWLGDMELSATAVISVQRSLLLVRGDLMVRLGKVVSDPRAQMVSLREQTVLNPDLDDPGVVLQPHARPPLLSTD